MGLCYCRLVGPTPDSVSRAEVWNIRRGSSRQGHSCHLDTVDAQGAGP